MNVKPEPIDGLLMPEETRIAHLIKEYVFDEILPADWDSLNEWRYANESHRQIFEKETDPEVIKNNFHFMVEVDVKEKLKVLKHKIHFNTPRRVLRLRNWAIAASVIIIAGMGTRFFLNEKRKSIPIHTVVSPDNILPGSRKAYLVLRNEKKIIALGDEHDSLFAGQHGIAIMKQNGIIENISTDTNTIADRSYNVITTPMGAVYSLTLSDGSRVWINAGSSVRFPTVFRKEQRQVGISGEVYFEIAKNPLCPFVVNIADRQITVEVLGTHFNINAYPDEDMTNITLLEGSVKVINKNRQAVVLKPLEELTVSGTGGFFITKQVDTSISSGWKNEIMQLRNTSIEEAMKIISRWYNIEVVYEGSPPNGQFSISLHRNTPFSELIEILNSNNIPCRLEGRKLVIGFRK